MKVVIAVVFLFLQSASIGFAQSAKAKVDDSTAIKAAVINFIDGIYAGDVARVEKAIYPDINRATPRDLAQTGRSVLAYSTYSGLLENTRSKAAALDDTARHIAVQILDKDDDLANVKMTSASFSDYLQLLRLDGQWRIVNALSAPGTRGPQRLPDFSVDKERAAIERTALEYISGLYGSDAKRVELSIDPDFNKVTLNPQQPNGKASLRRQHASTTIESALARIGKQDEVYRDFRVRLVDAMDGLAVVRVDVIGAYEYLQLYKAGSQWRVLNSVAKVRTDLSLAQAMTVIVGDSMPDFTLPTYGGGEFALSKLRGKNVLLIFPRGWLGTSWCTYCPYQYLELEQRLKNSDLKSKYNLEIAFVMPYGSEKVKDWLEKFPDAMKSVEGIKNPQPLPAAGSIQEQYAAWARKAYPLKLDAKKDDPHTAIPVIIDENRTLSRQVKVFTGFWDGVSSDQNIASVFIVDKNGILKFKYIGQMTEDRPSVDYLLDFIGRM
jgi:alkyl hydroperoxide reductase subunit AhpC